MTARDHLPPDLRPILEAARDRFGAKLNYLEVDGQTAGRGVLPAWWQMDWSAAPQEAPQAAGDGRGAAIGYKGRHTPRPPMRSRP